MKKFKVHTISKTDVYIRYFIAAVLTILLLMCELENLPLYLLVIFNTLLVYSGLMEKSLIKSALYPDK